MIYMFIYIIIISYAFGLFFGKKFYESLAPSIILHGIITLISWFIFDDLRIGCYLYIFASLVYVIFKTFLTISKNKKLDTSWFKDKTFIIFVFMFIFLCALNYGRHFIHWDEYSHWGMFIKESFRLNKYFSASPLSFSHKDYVSFTTIIIYNFLKVAGKCTEPLCYIALTTFLFSMILPIFSYIRFVPGNILSKTNLKSYLFLGFIFLIPYFLPYTSFYMYVMTDSSLGIAIFYCLYVIYTLDKNSNSYNLFLLTLVFTMLTLVRMEGFAFVPLILLFIFISNNKKISYYIIPVVIAFSLWALLNFYIKTFIHNSGIQSYGSVKLTQIIDVLLLNTNKIPYIKELAIKYIQGLLKINMFLHASYIASIFIVTVPIYLIGYFSKNKRTILIGTYILLAFLYKAILMFFLYATRFSEGEAMVLASFDRYMSSFVMGMTFFMALEIAIHYYDENCKKVNMFFIITYLCIILYSMFIMVRSIIYKHVTKSTYYPNVIELTATTQYRLGVIEKIINPRNTDILINLSDKLEKLYEEDKKVILLQMDDSTNNTYSRIALQYYTDCYNNKVMFLNNKEPSAIVSELKEYDYVVVLNEANIINEKYKEVGDLTTTGKLMNYEVVAIKKP